VDNSVVALNNKRLLYKQQSSNDLSQVQMT